jgi:hypothetical protein
MYTRTIDEIKHLLELRNILWILNASSIWLQILGGKIRLVSNVGNFLLCDHGYNTRYIEVWDRKVFLEGLRYVPRMRYYFCHIREYFKDTIEGS